MIDSEKKSICFVAHFAYGALAGGSAGFIGGVERQTSLMAKWFAKRGYKISMITWDEGQKDGEEIDGVKVFKMCREDEGIKGLRFLWPRWTSLVAAMKRADADIYYQNCGEYITGQVALWCRKHNRKFVYSVANDTDCDKSLPEMHKIRERVLYRYGLGHADNVIVQTKKQRDMLRTDFGQNSIVIPMPCPGLSEEEYAELEKKHKKSANVLWLGRICEQKRPDRLLELAKLCDGVQFDFVGPNEGSKYSNDIIEQVKQVPNITYHGPVSRKDVSKFYKNARVFCCTSDFEGFPNTFLEAWSFGLPIVSTFDPDGLIAEKNIGIVAEDIRGLASGINMFISNFEFCQKVSGAARRYYQENHTVDSVMPKFEKVFENVITSVI